MLDRIPQSILFINQEEIMMKRILAILLAAMMVMSVMVFTTAAEETETAAPVDFIPIFTEDETPDTDMTLAQLKAWRSADGIGNWTNATSYDGDEKAVVVSFTGKSTAKGQAMFRYCVPEIDISAMTTLCFDLYISDLDLANVNGEGWKLQLYSNADRNDASAVSLDRRWSTFHRTALKAGWNHFEIPLAWFAQNGAKGATYVAGQFAGFRFFNNTNAMGAAGETTTFMMKNVYFTSKPTDFVFIGEGDMPNKDFTQAGADFFGSGKWNPKRTYTDSGFYPYNAGDSASNWGQWSAYSSMVTFGYHGASDKGVYATLTGLPAAPKAGTVQFKLTMNGSAPYTVSLADYETLAFDWYVSDTTVANASKVVWRVQLQDYGNTTMRYDATLATIANLSQKTIVNGWNHFEIPLSAFSNYETSKASGKMMKQFLIQSNDTTNALGADGKSVTFAVKNFTFTNKASDVILWSDDAEWARTVGLKNNTSGADPSTFEGTNWNYYAAGSASSATYDATENAYVATMSTTSKSQSAVGFRMAKGQTATYTLDGLKAFCFDLYISDLDLMALDTNEWRVRLITSGGNTDIQKTLPYFASLCGTTLKDGWNHFEVPLSLAASLKAGNFTQVQFYNSGAATFGGSADAPLILKMKNLHFTKSACTIGFGDVQPTLNDSFKLTYNLTTDDTFSTVPMVEFSITDPTRANYRYAKAEVMAGATANAFTASFDRILANRLSDVVTVTAKALNKSGDIVVTTETFTMRDYCDTMLGQSSDETLNALLSDTLRYGAAVQKVGKYNLENLATDITNASKMTEAAALDTAKLAAFAANPLAGTPTEGGPVWKSATLVLSGEVKIRYTFTATSVDELTVTVNGATYDKDDFVSKGNNTYYVEVPVNAALFNEDFVAHFGADDTYKVTYSVNAYIARNYKRFNEKDGGSDMYNLIVAIYNYGVSAANYVANH